MKEEEEQYIPQVPEKRWVSFRKALGYAWDGLVYTIRTQRNMKNEMVISGLAVIGGAFLRLTPVEWSVIVICIGLVLMAELLNTAIETIVNLVSPDYHPLAKIAKDVAAGIVLFLSIISLLAGAIIYFSAFFRLLGLFVGD